MVRPHIQEAVTQMINSGDSQQMIVAEFVDQLISEREDEEFIAVCLDEIIDSCQSLKRAITKGV